MSYNVQVVPNQAQAAHGPRYPINQPIHPYLNFVPASPPYVIAFAHDKRLIPHIPLLCGTLASQIQSTATNSGLRMYLYNHVASNNFANENFAEVAELAAKLTVYSVNRSNNPHSAWEDHIGQAVTDAILYALAICYRNDPGLQAAVNLPAPDVQDIQNLLANFNNLQEHLARMFPSPQGNNSMYPVNHGMPANMVANMIPVQQQQMMQQPMMMPNQGMMMPNPNQMVQTPYGVMSQQQWMTMQGQAMQQQHMQQPVYQGQPGMMMHQPMMQPQYQYPQQQQQQYHPTQSNLMAPPAPQVPQGQDNGSFYGRRWNSPKVSNVSMAPQPPAQPAPLYRDTTAQNHPQAQGPGPVAPTVAPNQEKIMPGYGRQRPGMGSGSGMPTPQQMSEHYKNQPVQAEPVIQNRQYQATEVQGTPKRMNVQARQPIAGGDMPPAVDLNNLAVPVPNPMPKGGWVSDDQLHLYVPFVHGDRTYVWKPTMEQPYRPWTQPWSQKLYYRIDRVTGRVWYVIVEMTEEEKMDYAKHNPNCDGRDLDNIVKAVENGPCQLIRTTVQVHRDPSLDGSKHEPTDLSDAAEPDTREEVDLPEFSHVFDSKDDEVLVTDCQDSGFIAHDQRRLTLYNKTGKRPDAMTTNHQVVSQYDTGDGDTADRFLRGLQMSTTMYQVGAHISSALKKAEASMETKPGLYRLVKNIDEMVAKAYQDRIVFGLSIDGLKIHSMVDVVDNVEKVIADNFSENFVDILNKDVREYMTSLFLLPDADAHLVTATSMLNDDEAPDFKVREEVLDSLIYMMVNSRVTSLKVTASKAGLGELKVGDTITVQANTQMEVLVRRVFEDKVRLTGEQQWLVTAEGYRFRLYKGLLGDDFYVVHRVK